MTVADHAKRYVLKHIDHERAMQLIDPWCLPIRTAAEYEDFWLQEADRIMVERERKGDQG